MERIKLLTLAVAIIGFAAIGVQDVVANRQRIQLKEVQLRDTTAELKQLELKYDTLNKNLETELHEKNINVERVKQLEEEKTRLEQEKVKLENDLQAKRDEKERIAKLQTTQKVYAATAAPTKPTGGSVGNCGDNMYKQYIYQHESGCMTDRWNSSGCYGIGQACPASKIAHCGADFACQDAWFSNYAVQRYGSWEGAYNFWVANRWW